MKAWIAALRVALHALRRQLLRSTLTSLGILIGVAAVVVVVSLGRGARDRVGNELQSLGTNVIYVFARPAPKSGARVQNKLPKGLTVSDAEAIRRESTVVSAVTVYSSIRLQAQSIYTNDRIDVVGADQFYLDVRGYQLEHGRNLTPEEVKTKAKVCLIGTTVTEKLFGDNDPIGQSIRIGRYAFTVIGTLASKGESPFGVDQDDRIVIPIGSWFSRISPSIDDRVQIVMASAKTPDLVPQAARQITEIMRQRHLLREGDEQDFQVRTQQQFQKTQESIFDVLTMLLLSVAAISLFVGGVGVMNILLVSVNERRREIGIRMAIGARARDIRLQFLLESLLLTLGGGVSGLTLAFLVIQVLQVKFQGALGFSPDAIWVALLTSVGVGVIFGLLPAQRAAHLDPIEALRHE